MPFGQYKAKLVFDGGADNPTVQTLIDTISDSGMSGYNYEGTGNWCTTGNIQLDDTFYLVDFVTGAEIQILPEDGTFSAYFPIPGSSHFWRIAVAAFPPGLLLYGIEMWDDNIGSNPINVACELDIAINHGTNPAPSAPTGLTGTRDSANVNLSWDTVSGATSYNAYRDGTLIGLSATNSYDDLTGVPIVQYTYTVKAVNGSGESGASNSWVAAPITTPPINPSDDGAGLNAPRPWKHEGTKGAGRDGLVMNLKGTRQ